MIPVAGVRMGGPAVAVVQLSRALGTLGHHSEIWTSNTGSVPNATVRARLRPEDLPQGADEVPMRVFRARPPHRLLFAPGLGRALRHGVATFDVVHIHSLFLYPQLAASSHARRAGVPYVVAPCGALDPALRGRSRHVKRVTDVAWQRRMLDGAAAIHYKTGEERELTADLGYAAPAIVVPNGIDWDGFQRLPSGASFRAEHLGGHRGPVVTNLGRISHKKCLDVLIRAFADVRTHVPDAHLALIGPDDEGLGPELRGLAARLGVAEHVTFTGLLTGPARLSALAATDVWALPSTTENFGNAVVEALAAGLPAVLSPDINVATAAAAAGGAVVAERTPAAFATAITELLRSPERRAALGARARAFARRYEWPAVAPRMADAYAELVRG